MDATLNSTVIGSHLDHPHEGLGKLGVVRHEPLVVATPGGVKLNHPHCVRLEHLDRERDLGNRGELG